VWRARARPLDALTKRQIHRVARVAEVQRWLHALAIWTVRIQLKAHGQSPNWCLASVS